MKYLIKLIVATPLFILSFGQLAVAQKPEKNLEPLPSLYKEVKDSLRALYYGKMPPDREFLTKVLKGGLSYALDDLYVELLTPEEAKIYAEDELYGEYGGIGIITFRYEKNYLTILEVFPKTPAERVGLVRGDKIYSINRTSIKNLSDIGAQIKIRGRVGTKIQLEVVKVNSEKEGIKQISLTREKIIQPEAKSYFQFIENNRDRIAYFRLPAFSSQTTLWFLIEVGSVIRKHPAISFIIDLRNNYGGPIAHASEIASLWIEKGKIFYKDKTRKGVNIGKISPPPLPELRISLKNNKSVFLVNGLTASSAEIVAGAIQDYGVAPLIGERTYGKNIFTDARELQNGYLLIFTAGEWLTPSGKNIATGLTPDIEVYMSQDDIDMKRDLPLEKAVEILQNK